MECALVNKDGNGLVKVKDGLLTKSLSLRYGGG